MIQYRLEVFVDGMRWELNHESEIIIKQFLFTEDEIIEDLSLQQKYIKLSNILNQNQMGDINLQKINKEDIINFIPDGTGEVAKKFLKAAIDH